jgi:methyl-accepting chemotaxis protein
MKKRLSTRVAAIMAALMLITMTALIAVAAILSAQSVTEGTNGTMSAIAKQNSVQIQFMLNESAEAADGLKAYVQSNYEPPDAFDMRTQFSDIYSNRLTESAKSIESMALETAWRKVAVADNLVGLGIFFEPYAFDSSIERYAVYIDETMAADKNVYKYTEDYTTQTYYKDAVETNRVVITEPFMWGGNYMVSIAYPIDVDGQVIGAVIADLSMDSFGAIKITHESFPSMHAGIVNANGTVMFDSQNPDVVGSSLSQLVDQNEYSSILEKFSAGEPFRMNTVNSAGNEEINYFDPIQLSSETWWSQTVISARDFNATAVQLLTWLIIVAVIAVVLVIVLIYFILRTQLNPVRDIVKAAQKIENGDLDISIKIKSQDEIGQLAHSFMNMSATLRLIIDDIGYVLTELSNNNFDVSSNCRDKYVGDYGSILESLRKIKHTLNITLLTIRKASEQVSSGSEQVSSGAQTLAQGATEQAASVEELFASINQVTDQVGDTAKNAADTSEITNQVSSVMNVSLTEMHQLRDAMSDIAAASEKIRNVIKDIEDIAFQTNILALNAAVEAARAGAAGKGFAVVADEVKNLAQKSSVSAKNTTALIEDAIASVTRGVTLVENADNTFENVSEKTAVMRQLVSEISTATETQSESIQSIKQAVEQISEVVQMNSATAEESAAASEELLSQANMLHELVAKFILTGHQN